MFSVWRDTYVSIIIRQRESTRAKASDTVIIWLIADEAYPYVRRVIRTYESPDI